MMRTSLSAARLRRLALLSSSLAALGMPGQAFAQTAPQSFNAPNPTITSGSVNFVRGVNEVYTITSPTAVLDWTPSDTGGGTAPINFQNVNSSVTYTGASNFTILNRIVPASPGRAITFNGTVNSRVGNAAGGSVWFYSPGGIILSSTAVFDVGNLLLTARDPINGAATIGSTTSFAGGGTGEAGVQVSTGAQIRALAEGSYVALVAPRVFVDGSIRVNGQAALVGAEQATLSINNGLFDIVLTTGSDANNAFPVVVGGSVSGPASTGTADPHAVYLVTVPKNVATTALIQGTGTIGFDVATQAGIVNGRVVLSNGYNIAAGQIGSRITATNVGDVHLIGSRFTSDVTVSATQNAYAGNPNSTPQFDGNLTMSGLRAAHVGSRQNGATLRVGGNVSLTSAGATAVVNNVLTATGGETLAYTDTGGILNIVGNLNMNSNAVAPASTGPVAARGGTSQIFTNNGGGALTVGGTTTISVSASGNSTPVANRAGATVTGGLANIVADAGDITLNGAVSMFADATGTTSASTVSATATAGSAAITTGQTAGTGRIVANAGATLLARAFGDGSTIANGVNGTAVGGNVTVQTRGANLTIAGALVAEASGDVVGAGNGVVGSAGSPSTGGVAQLVNNGGTASIGSLSFIAYGRGTADRGSTTGTGGAGTGGLAIVNGLLGTTTITGSVSLEATGTGGNKIGGTIGGGGAGSGGNAIVRTTNGTVSIGATVTLRSAGTGGSSTGTGVSGNGGTGTGGGARIDTLIGATGGITVGGFSSLDARGIGGNATVTAGATGGAGVGGAGTQQTNFVKGAYVVTQGGSITLAGATADSTGTGGTGAVGGAGTGGTSQVTSLGGSVNISGTVQIVANATGGAALSATGVGGGAGGAATGGQALSTAGFLQAPNTPLTNARVTLGATGINSRANGGAGAPGVNGGAGGAGGAAQGGTASAFANASTLGITTTSLISDSQGIGGAGGAGGTGTGGAGGAGTGGVTGGIAFGTISGLDLPPNTGLAIFGNTSIILSGVGGAGGSGATGGAGGTGSGGLTTILARGTPVSFGSLLVSSQGVGGAGGTGTATAGASGNAVGGAIGVAVSNRFQRTERGQMTAGATSFFTNALAGSNGTGGTLTGGSLSLDVTSGTAIFSSLQYQNLATLPASGGLPTLRIDVADGALASNGNLTINSTGDAVISARDGGTLSAAAQLSVFIRGNILPRAANVPTGLLGSIVSAGGQNWTATNSLSLASNIITGGSLFIAAPTVSVADLSAVGFVGIDARNLTAGNISSQSDDVSLYHSSQGSSADRVVTATITTPNGAIYGETDGALTTGSLFAGQEIAIETGGALTINGSAIAGALALVPQGPLPDDASLYLFSQNGPITTGTLTAQVVEVAQGELDDDGNTIGTPAPVRVGDVIAEAINITGIGDVTTASLTVNDLYPRLPLDAEEAPIVFVGALGNLVTGNATGTEFGLLAARGSTTTGDLTFTGSVAVTAGQGATVGRVTTGRGTGDLFFASNTSVLFDDPLIAPYFLDLLDLGDAPDTPFGPSLFLQVNPVAMGGALTVTGPLSTGTVRTGSNTARFAAVDAAQRIQVTTNGLATFDGATASPRIEVASGDIAIGNAGSLGAAATTTLNLTARASVATLGGAGGASGYELSNAEAGRLTAAQIGLTANGTVTVRDLTLGGSAATRPNITGTAASFTVSAPGTIRVEGAAALNGAASTDQLVLSSGQRIEVATDAGGSLGVFGTQTGTLGGSLALTAPVIAVAPGATLSQLAADPRYAGRDAALAAPASNPRAEGYLQANRMLLTASNVIAIQNSGSAATMAGFTAGAGGLTIANSAQAGAQPVDVRVYGRTQQASGSFAVNDATLATVTRSAGSGTFSATAAVNGCLFSASSCTPPNTGGGNTGGGGTGGGGTGNSGNDGGSGDDGQGVAISPALEALVNEATNGDPVQAAILPAIRIVRLLDDTAIEAEPTVTDPVAGGGNASLWDENDDEDAEKDGEGGGGDGTTPAPAQPGTGGGR